MNYLSSQWIGVVFIFIVTVAMVVKFESFLNIIKRMRWLFVSILLIYAFATPGEYVQDVAMGYVPTIEGMQLGLLQVMRLLIALGALTLLYADSTTEHLILGLYMLLKPFNYLGFDVERFAVRLSLTLKYVEDFAVRGNRQRLSFEQFETMLLADENLPDNGMVTFTIMPFKLIDKWLAGILILIFLGLFVYESTGLRLSL